MRMRYGTAGLALLLGLMACSDDDSGGVCSLSTAQIVDRAEAADDDATKALEAEIRSDCPDRMEEYIAEILSR